MDNKQFAKELERRTKEFAVQIIKMCAKLPNTPEGKVIRTQLVKSATSIGANYREANRARSRADFRNKINLCEGEFSETQYWLEMILETAWLPWEQMQLEKKSCDELLAIFSSIGKNCLK